MSDKEVDESKAKRGPDSSDGNEDDEKRATRKKARVDYSEDKSKATQPSNEKEEADEEEEEDDDEIQDVTPANIKSKSEETVNEPRPTRSTSDDLMGLPMEPTGLEGAGNLQFCIFFLQLQAAASFEIDPDLSSEPEQNEQACLQCGN